jgi:hypothetical protein
MNTYIVLISDTYCTLHNQRTRTDSYVYHYTDWGGSVEAVEVAESKCRELNQTEGKE